MIKINRGTIEERILKILENTYPVTVNYLKKELHLSKPVIMRTLKKLQVKKVLQLDVLPDKIYVRLLRNDFIFINKKRQHKFIKRKNTKKQGQEEYKDKYDFMYN